MMVPGKPGLAHLKVNSVRLPGTLFWAATPLPEPTTRSSPGTRMCISAVKRLVIEPDHREPAAGVKQDADGVVDGGQFDAFDRAGVGALKRAASTQSV